MPAANAVIIFAQQYGVFNQHMISAAFLVCFLVFTPVMFIVASLLTDTTESTTYKELNLVFQIIVNMVSFISCIGVTVTFAITPIWRTRPTVYLLPLALYTLW